MRLLPVLLVPLLAGCISADTGPGPTPTEWTSECETLPDGTAFDCFQSHWSDTVTVPELTSGWRCVGDYDSNDLYAELWVDGQGMAGLYWDWERWKPDGLAWQRLAIYEADGVRGAAAHSAYAPTGFMTLDAPIDPAGPVWIYIHFWEYRAWRHDGAAWQVAEDVDFTVNRWGPQYWMTATTQVDGDPVALGLMRERDPTGDDDPYRWYSTNWDGEVGGEVLKIGGRAIGQKYEEVSFQAFATDVDVCALPRAPAALQVP